MVENLNIVTKKEASPSINYLREEDLRGHLENENGSAKENTFESSEEEVNPTETLSSQFADPKIEDDYLLREALMLLKGLSILEKNTIKQAD